MSLFSYLPLLTGLLLRIVPAAYPVLADQLPKLPAASGPIRQLPPHLSCFAGVDTARGGNKYRSTAGCFGTFYKRVNSRFVLQLTPHVPEQYDSCSTIRFKKPTARLTAELLVFEPGQAHMRNTCSDVRVVNVAKPRKRLTARSGEVVVAYNRPVRYYGNPTYALSILVRRLEFTDPQTKERIVLTDQLLWNITNIKELG